MCNGLDWGRAGGREAVRTGMLGRGVLPAQFREEMENLWPFGWCDSHESTASMVRGPQG